MTSHTNTTRRAILAGAASASAVGLPSSAHAAEPDCPAAAAYREWRAARDAIDAGAYSEESAERWDLFRAMWRAEERLYRAEPAGAEKVTFKHGRGGAVQDKCGTQAHPGGFKRESSASVQR